MLTHAPIMTKINPPLAHLKVGIQTQLNGHKRPLSNVVFLYPSKTQALMCLVLSVLVGCIEQPLKRLAGACTGSANLIHSTAQSFAPFSGGYLLHTGDHNHVTN